MTSVRRHLSRTFGLSRAIWPNSDAFRLDRISCNSVSPVVVRIASLVMRSRLVMFRIWRRQLLHVIIITDCDTSLQQTRQWNGLVKSILDGDADMAITALQITPDRSSVIDFSVPFLETGISILVAVRDGVISPMAFLGLRTITFRSWCLLVAVRVASSSSSSHWNVHSFLVWRSQSI